MHKNICLIIDTLAGGGGAERVVLSLAQGLSELGCRVDVIVLDDKKSSYALDQFDFQVHHIKTIKHPIRQIRAWKKVKPLKDKIAKIKKNGIEFDLFVANLGDSRRACKWAKLPNTYYCIHIAASKTVFSKLIHKISYFFINRLSRNLNLITVSKGIEQDLLKFGVKPSDVQTIYNPFDFNDIRQQAKLYQVDEQDYIIHLGRFNSQKRHDVLINAYKKSGVKQKLLLFGDGRNIEKTRQLVTDLDLQDQVIFKGFNSNPYPYIKNAKALVLSSDYEGFGMVLVEALVLGTPIVSTNCPSGPNEILIDELAHFLSPIGDTSALAKNIKKMVENSVEITDKYINRFSTEECAKQYLALCD